MHLYPSSGKTRGERAEKALKVQRNESDNTSNHTGCTQGQDHRNEGGERELLFRLRGAEFLANAIQPGVKGLLKGKLHYWGWLNLPDPLVPEFTA